MPCVPWCKLPSIPHTIPPIRDILVRIRIQIPGSAPLTNGSGPGSGSKSFLIDFKKAKEKIIFFVKMVFCRHYFTPLNTFKRKGKDLELDPDPDPHLRLMDPDPGGPKNMRILRIDPQHYKNPYLSLCGMQWPYGSTERAPVLFSLKII
jgi:hypothetical protein